MTAILFDQTFSIFRLQNRSFLHFLVFLDSEILLILLTLDYFWTLYPWGGGRYCSIRFDVLIQCLYIGHSCGMSFYEEASC